MTAMREIEFEIFHAAKGLDNNFTSTQERHKKMEHIVRLARAWEVLTVQEKSKT